MSAIKKYTDWRTWWDGLRTNLLQAAGTSIVTLLGTNGVGAMGVPGIAMSWKTAVAQFLVHLVFSIGVYMKDNQPKVITETVETTFESASAVSGVSVSQSSKKTTTTPVADIISVPVKPASTEAPPKEQ